MPESLAARAIIRSPESDAEWSAYYDLRWRILREPWQQPRGSERDELDATATHRLILDIDSRVVAIGRLHALDNQTGQIRYMAVERGCERQGLGTRILSALERAAIDQALNTIRLHARAPAVPFYQHHGYTTLEASHTLFDTIPHYLMQKSLGNA